MVAVTVSLADASPSVSMSIDSGGTPLLLDVDNRAVFPVAPQDGEEHPGAASAVRHSTGMDATPTPKK